MVELDLTGFKKYLTLKDTRQITIDRHIRSLKLLSKSIDSFSYSVLKDYLDNKKISGLSGGTLNGVITTIREYAKFTNLPDIIKLPLYTRKQKVIRRTLSDAQIEAFLAVPIRKWQLESYWKQWQVFWALLAFCALRPSEAKQLRVDDIDLANQQIILRSEITKTDQFSTIPLFPNIMPIVENYVKSCKPGLLFPPLKNTGSKYLSQAGWSDDFKHRLKYIGVDKVEGLVPYSLRHSCATRWIANDMNLYKVRRLMRHVKIEQTLTYEHMTSKHLQNTVVKFDPLVRKYAKPEEVLTSFKENIESFGLEQDMRFSEEFRKGLVDLLFKEGERLRNV